LFPKKVAAASRGRSARGVSPRCSFVIANRNRPVVVATPIEDFEALMETP
jgi:hypothetical protein